MIVFLAAALFAQTSGARPRFEDYAVKIPPFQGKIVQPRYATVEQEALRDAIEIDARWWSPQFAGYYVVVRLSPRSLVLFDARTGEIHGSPFANAESQFYLPPANWDPQEPRYRAESKLMVIPHVCPSGATSCATHYFVFENGQFSLIYKERVSPAPVIPSASPLLGRWEGESDLSNNFRKEKWPFVLVVTGQGNRLSGRLLERKTWHTVHKITPTRPDLSAYRLEVDDRCWNLAIEAGEISGMWNGGPCTNLGVGAGARLFNFAAKRKP